MVTFFLKVMFDILRKKPSPPTTAQPPSKEERLEEAYSVLRDALVLLLIPPEENPQPSTVRNNWLSIISTYDMALKGAINQYRYIGVYGSPKMGKSTLLNSIVGENILPESPIPKTGTVIDLFRDDTSHYYTVHCERNGERIPSSFNTVDKVRDFLEQQAGQNAPCDKVEVRGPFKKAHRIFTNYCVLRDTPGAEAEADRAIEERLQRDSSKTLYALQETHIPIFCISKQTLQGEEHKAFYDKYFSNKECIHVITRCDDVSEHEYFANLFSAHFKLPDDEAHHSVTCTGMSDIESKKVDINLEKLGQAIEDYTDIPRLRKRLVTIAEIICNDIKMKRTAPNAPYTIIETQIERIKTSLATISSIA